MKIKRGEIYLADLNPATGSEQGGVRPVLVIQNNVGNKYSPTTIVASITSQNDKKRWLPTHCSLPHSAGLKQKSIVMMEQIRVIDNDRIIQYIGKVTPRFMKILDKRIMISLGISTSIDKNKTDSSA